jgi:hypothetical protein
MGKITGCMPILSHVDGLNIEVVMKKNTHFHEKNYRQNFFDYEKYAEDELGMKRDVTRTPSFEHSWSNDSRSESFREKIHMGKGPKGYRRSDTRIYEDVCSVLSDRADIDAGEVEVEVLEGCVYLKGEVLERNIKKRIEAAIEHLPGVRDVQNEIMVSRI